MSEITNKRTIARRKVVARIAKQNRVSVGVAKTIFDNRLHPKTRKRLICEALLEQTE